MFCEHGNIIGSCRECTPERYKAKVSAQILEDVDCPVWELLRRKDDDDNGRRCYPNQGFRASPKEEGGGKAPRKRHPHHHDHKHLQHQETKKTHKHSKTKTTRKTHQTTSYIIFLGCYQTPDRPAHAGNYVKILNTIITN